MDFSNHTDTSFVCMRDVFEGLMGKEVVVWLNGGKSPLGGTLHKRVGSVLHLTSPHSIKNTYIPVDAVIAISSDA